jgi:hypothetical protein
LDIYDDALVIAYLQANEVPIGLTLRKGIVLCIGANISNWKAIFSYECGQMDK